jgi:hypothetical protein
MRVDFSFDQKMIEDNGYTMADIYRTVKSEFEKKNISCISDGETLSFSGGERKNDFSNMWAIILRLTRSDWFLRYATSCIWREDNDKWEDVLRQVKETA